MPFDGRHVAGQPRLSLGDPINADLLGWWPLNEAGGAIANDLSGYRQRGTLANGPTRVVGKLGRATAFAGGGAGSAYIDVGARPALVAAHLPLTIAAWVYPTGSGTRTVFAQYWDFSAPGDIGKMIRIEGGNVVYYTTSGSSAYQSATGGAVANSVWSLVVVTVSGTIAAPVYSITVNRTTSTGALGALRGAGPADRPVYLGNSRRNAVVGPGEGYVGHLGPVRVWGRVLAASERLRLYADRWAGAATPARRPAFLLLSGAAPLPPITAESVATLVVTGSASGTVALAGASAATLAVAGSAAGAVRVEGASAATLAVAGSAAGTVALAGASAVTTSVAGAAAGAVALAGATSATLSVAGAAAGAVAVAGSTSAVLSVSGAAAGAVALAAASAATLTVEGSAAGTVSLAAASAALLTSTGLSSGTVALAAASAATLAVTGSMTGTSTLLPAVASVSIAWTPTLRRATWAGEARRIPWAGPARRVTWRKE